MQPHLQHSKPPLIWPMPNAPLVPGSQIHRPATPDPALATPDPALATPDPALATPQVLFQIRPPATPGPALGSHLQAPQPLVLVLLPSPSLLVMLWKSFKHRKLFSFPALPTRTAPASGSALALLRLQQMDQPPTCRCPAAQVVLQTHPPATPGPVHVPA